MLDRYSRGVSTVSDMVESLSNFCFMQGIDENTLVDDLGSVIVKNFLEEYLDEPELSSALEVLQSGGSSLALYQIFNAIELTY